MTKEAIIAKNILLPFFRLDGNYHNITLYDAYWQFVAKYLLAKPYQENHVKKLIDAIQLSQPELIYKYLPSIYARFQAAYVSDYFIVPEIVQELCKEVEKQTIVRYEIYYSDITEAYATIFDGSYLIPDGFNQKCSLVYSTYTIHKGHNPIGQRRQSIDFYLVYEGLPEECKKFDLCLHDSELMELGMYRTPKKDTGIHCFRVTIAEK